MKLYKVTDTSNAHIMGILHKGLSTAVGDQKTLENYHPDYRDNNANLFYILEHGRYADGGYFCVCDDEDNFLASSGWHPYDETTALVSSRAYVSPLGKFKYPIATFITPVAIREAWAYPELWMCFNDHNYGFFKGFSRGKWENHPTYKYFEPVGEATVNYTQQWVVRVNKPRFEADGLLEPKLPVLVG
jgi:hypothetical protein